MIGGGALLTSLITLYAMARVWARAFWRDPVEEAPAGPPAEDHRRG